MTRLVFCIGSVMLIAIGSEGASAEAQQPWAPVPSADLAQLSPDDFADDELDLPYHLAHFHRLANGVIEDGPDRGFIGISLWRREGDNEPYNARVMENILSLVWFYTADRRWNPYRASPPVRQRLEAAMEFWCNMQNEDGRFSEYGPQRWNLPATAFATKFMGQALILLAENPDCPIDPDIHQRVIDANRRAIMAVFTREDFYRHGSGFSNQYTNAWAGAAAHLTLYPRDEQVRRLMLQRMAESKEDFQSPAGYHYEAHGPDFAYGLGTHTSNHKMAWVLTRGTPAEDHLVESELRWIEWLSYNLVREPDGSGFAVNAAVETRQRRPFVVNHENPMFADDRLALGRAWARSDEQVAAALRLQRETLERDWPQIPPLQVGSFSAFTPYTFLHRTHDDYAPAAAQKEQATRMQPYLARERFTHQRAGGRSGLVCTFIRRPAHYAAFNATMTEDQHRPQQRFGLGLLWGPRIGTVLQSQARGDAAAWGTQAAGAERVYETAPLLAGFTVAGRTVQPEPGGRDLPAGDLTADYPLGESGRKSVLFAMDRIVIEVEHPGTFVEVLPLVKGEQDELIITDGSIELRRDGEALLVQFDSPHPPETAEIDQGVGPHRRIVAVRIPATQRLRYEMSIRPIVAE